MLPLEPLQLHHHISLSVIKYDAVQHMQPKIEMFKNASWAAKSLICSACLLNDRSISHLESTSSKTSSDDKQWRLNHVPNFSYRQSYLWFFKSAANAVNFQFKPYLSKTVKTVLKWPSHADKSQWEFEIVLKGIACAFS